MLDVPVKIPPTLGGGGGQETEKYKIYYELSKIFKKFDEMKKAKEYLKTSLNKFEEYNMNWWKKQCETALEDINT